jgi:hypothetical protein
MPRSGEHCIQPGVYAPDCGDDWSVHMAATGDEFPRCPHCHRLVRYTLIASSLPGS